MRQTLTILILILSFQNLFCQVDSALIILKSSSKIDTIAKIKISDFNTHFNKADLTPWTVLKDSGSYNAENLKTGFWKEFPIDTTALSSDKNIREKSALSETYKPQIVRCEGFYKNGKKEGDWSKCRASIRTEPFFWDIESTSKYKNNIKNGKEILFEPFSNDTLMVIIYQNGVPIKIIE